MILRKKKQIPDVRDPSFSHSVSSICKITEPEKMPVLISMVEQLQYLPWRENWTKILDTATKAFKQVGIELNLSSDLNFRELFIKQRINPGTTLNKRLGMDCKSLRLWCTNCSGKNGTESKTENVQVPVHAARKSDNKKSCASPERGFHDYFLGHYHWFSLFGTRFTVHRLRMFPQLHACRSGWKQSQQSGEHGADGAERAPTEQTPCLQNLQSHGGDASSHCSWHLLDTGVSGDAGNQF